MSKAEIASDWAQLSDFCSGLVATIQSDLSDRNMSGAALIRVQSSARNKLDQLAGDIDTLSRRLGDMEKRPSDYKLTENDVGKRKAKLNDLKFNYDRLCKMVTDGQGGARKYIAGEKKQKNSMPAVENDRTIDMDDTMLLQKQQNILASQDDHLDDILHGVSRLKVIGQDIGSELDLHSTLLNDLDKGMDRTTHGLKSNTERAVLLQEESGSGWCAICTIIILMGLILMLAVTNYACHIFNKAKC